MFTLPEASQTTDRPRSGTFFSFTVTFCPMVMVVKWKTLSPSGSSGGFNVAGSKTTVPGVVKFSAPSEPFEPLLKTCASAVVHAINSAAKAAERRIDSRPDNLDL
jgi:hypothetical protein